jgi:hypothetical protein
VQPFATRKAIPASKNDKFFIIILLLNLEL